MFSSASIMPVLAALMMASYGLMTRFAARNDWPKLAFSGLRSRRCCDDVYRPFFWRPPVGTDWI